MTVKTKGGKMWMASEMTLSSEWKTSELRQVAIALQREGESAAGRPRSTESKADARSEAAESEAVARLEQERAAGEDPELRDEVEESAGL